jgi:hypothetical protein
MEDELFLPFVSKETVDSTRESIKGLNENDNALEYIAHLTNLDKNVYLSESITKVAARYIFEDDIVSARAFLFGASLVYVLLYRQAEANFLSEE